MNQKAPEEVGQDKLIAAALVEAAVTVHRGLARRMAAQKGDAKDTIAVLSDEGVFLASRKETAQLLLRTPALRPLGEGLESPPPEGYLWVLCLRFAAASVRPLRIDRRLLTFRRPSTLAQEQFLDAFLRAASEAIRRTLRDHRPVAAGGGGDQSVVAFLHDSGPGIIYRQQLQEQLRDHGFFAEAEIVGERPQGGHLWVWISSGHGGGTAGLRQLAIAHSEKSLPT